MAQQVLLNMNMPWSGVRAPLPELFGNADRVLEVGAGAGIFTLPIARHCREVTAVDISRNMLDALENKAADEGISKQLNLFNS